MNLKETRKGRGPQEIAGFLRVLEDSIVATLKTFGVESVGKCLQQKSKDATAADETGVWVGPRKIASLGIGVKRWVTYHGAAINLSRDPEAFVGMNPCGFQKNVMVSLEEILEKPLDREHFTHQLKQNLLQNL